jgi:uncharacterized protein (TIGR03435 family)
MDRRTNLQRSMFGTVSIAAALFIAASSARAQSAFDVASIRPTDHRIQFERNGKTEFAYGTLKMRDVTVGTCIHLAYGTPLALIQLPASYKEERYDITAKTDPATPDAQMRLMMQALLKERFNLAFHWEKKEMHVYALAIAKGGVKMRVAAPGQTMSHENSATGMTARSIAMPELADYLSDPLNAPLTDATGLTARYDFEIDFTPYVDMVRTEGVRPDPAAVIKAALKGDLGLDLIQSKKEMPTLVVDHVETPSSN